jgi:cell division protein ZapA (FtsZ GTPase activity inhibitor)
MKVDRVGRAPSSAAARLKTRLAAYSRYAAVVQEQLQALQEEDIDKFAELAEDRSEIQDEMDAVVGTIPLSDDLGPEERELLKAAEEEVGQAVSLDEEIESRLLRLRANVGGQIKALSERTGKAKRYVNESEGPTEGSPSRLNVRF